MESLCVLVLSLFTVSAAQSQPNIVFVFIDDLGWNDVGYHGSEIMTPTIDNLAAQGLKLENYHVQIVCSPTRGTFLTGRYTSHTCLQNAPIDGSDIGGLALDETTLFEKLKDVGYSTRVVGKWHLGMPTEEYLPTFRGADSFYGTYNGFTDHYTHEYCSFRDRTVCGLDLHDDVGSDLNPVDTENGTYSTYLYTQKAIEIIETHNTEQPLFLYLAYTAVHTPLQAPQEYIDMYPDIANPARRIYAAMMTYVDDAIGNLTNVLQETGMWDNTIFVFSSDNGGGLVGDNDPLRQGKNTYFNGGVQAAGFITSPLLSLMGENYYGLIHVSDWFATFVNLAGGNVTGMDLDSFDIWDSLNDNSESPRTEILYTIDPTVPLVGDNLYPEIFDIRVQSALRSGPWKIMTGDHGLTSTNLRLFNLEDDPTESTDVSDLYPDVVELLLERLAVYNETAAPVCVLESDLVSADPDNFGGVWVPWM